METKQLSRGQFLKQLGLSSAALMSFYCLGTGLTACSKGSDDPAPTTSPSGTTTGGNTSASADTGITGTSKGTSIDFTIDLTNSNFKSLKTEGSFTYVDDIIIANAKGAFVALSKICTHQGTTIDFRSGTNDFKCSNHGSEFKIDGSVQKDPATKALTVYKTELSTNGNSLRIKA
ncbi:Rieske (2Fe-2S) iron-sulfur domain-containing protein [Emticicia oligotrophica DSM 17448]|uniref:Rieske (2Fe-2S) iron-sulfur domain-containing protein n=1 Tax=Emticicia oligotrophica (strain DSM 17448 / CIP 109782 / MTCC 6937 / GPTSA100-15) TaxID=929562 RepID=A0ABN4AIC0_EMTOG|nr:Rieske 2Fe-2S domain-containing protein [Emticicia oligotrophica]AFK01835.1 Rieske (2Fe-2S) iron-sulfur domain-containing protein [Emticicia oligotrophica DSM 17448]